MIKNMRGIVQINDLIPQPSYLFKYPWSKRGWHENDNPAIDISVHNQVSRSGSGVMAIRYGDEFNDSLSEMINDIETGL